MQETWFQSLGWKIPWRREGYPLQYSGLENSMDRIAWQVIVHGVAKNWTYLSMCHCHSSKEQASFNLVAAVTIYSDFEAEENKICHCFHFPPFYLPWSDGTRCHDLSFLNVEFYASFFTLLFSPTSGGCLVSPCFLPLGWYHLHIWGCWYFSWQSWFQRVIHLVQHFEWCNLHIS